MFSRHFDAFLALPISIYGHMHSITRAHAPAKCCMCTMASVNGICKWIRGSFDTCAGRVHVCICTQNNTCARRNSPDLECLEIHVHMPTSSRPSRANYGPGRRNSARKARIILYRQNRHSFLPYCRDTCAS